MAQLKWPFTFLDQPRPPVIAVHGTGRADVNQLVDRPAMAAPKRLPVLQSTVRSLDHASAADPDKRWQPFPLFRGRTAALDLMSCHAAMLKPGFSPHKPHAHQDEELLIVLDGEADLLIADRGEFEGAQAIRVKPGDFAYYPAFQHHSIRNPGDKPVHYLMFRWNRAEAEAPSGRLKTIVVQDAPPAEAKDGRGFTMRTVFEGRSQWLRKFHCHSTRLEAGAGYAPHADAYDVAILVQSGRVRTLGREAGPGDLIYYPAGEVHGMRSIGDEPAHYLVFEWHGAPVALDRPALPPAPATLTAA
jgi:mannose-6-phosphate isomerase-like protein (cupin superfamily)